MYTMNLSVSSLVHALIGRTLDADFTVVLVDVLQNVVALLPPFETLFLVGKNAFEQVPLDALDPFVMVNRNNGGANARALFVARKQVQNVGSLGRFVDASVDMFRARLVPVPAQSLCAA